MEDQTRLKRAEYLLRQAALRSFMISNNQNFVKMPITIRNEIDKYLREYSPNFTEEPIDID